MLISVCITLIMLLPYAVAMGAEAKSPSALQVRVDGGHLSVQAADVSFETLLAEIAAKSGIEIYLQGRTAVRMTMDLRGIPLEMGIKRLIVGRDHAFIYGHDENRQIVPRQLYIYSKTGESEMTVVSPARESRAPNVKDAHSQDDVVIHARTPGEHDPMVSMQAIDPLMKIHHAQAPWLPDGFHQPDARQEALSGDLAQPGHLDGLHPTP